jgi:hypothetical protein
MILLFQFFDYIKEYRLKPLDDCQDYPLQCSFGRLMEGVDQLLFILL